ncbi:MAG: hypothetical protein ACD_21C00212G0005 [uncultured bacterium]|nr:MAG: hypothetical protein ACD_21C00212G0005 [uncultured bacterium]
MKKYCALLLLAPMLYGCSYLKAPANPPTPQEQLCSELKRNLIFNTVSTSPGSAASPTQSAEMMRLYEKHGCDKL